MEKQSSWIPIDPELYLPYHQKQFRVPCLFEPHSRGKFSPHGPGGASRQQQPHQYGNNKPQTPTRGGPGGGGGGGNKKKKRRRKT